MILEEVQAHPIRDDIFINKIITPPERVLDSDKKIIRTILLKEISLSMKS